jgi:flagellar biosynthesis/type III secretory pathway M-ring protein FliF/YscJ
VPLYKDPVILGSAGAVLLLILLIVVFLVMRKRVRAKEARHIAELREYVEKQLAAGHTREEIREAVKTAGWSEKDIGKVL